MVELFALSLGLIRKWCYGIMKLRVCILSWQMRAINTLKMAYKGLWGGIWLFLCRYLGYVIFMEPI